MQRVAVKEFNIINEVASVACWAHLAAREAIRKLKRASSSHVPSGPPGVLGASVRAASAHAVEHVSAEKRASTASVITLKPRVAGVNKTTSKPTAGPSGRLGVRAMVLGSIVREAVHEWAIAMEPQTSLECARIHSRVETTMAGVSTTWPIIFGEDKLKTHFNSKCQQKIHNLFK